MSEKVEVLTLLQPLPVGAPEMVRAADAELSERLNDGWRRIEMSTKWPTGTRAYRLSSLISETDFSGKR